MRRRWRRYLVIVGSGKESCHVTQRPAPTAHIEHGTDEKAHHVMQEPIRLDLEHEAAGPLAPPGRTHLAAVRVAFWSRALNGKAPKTAISDDRGRRRIQ